MTQRLWSFNDENAFCFSHCFHLPSASFLVEVIFVALVDSWKLVDFGMPLAQSNGTLPWLTPSIVASSRLLAAPRMWYQRWCHTIPCGSYSLHRIILLLCTSQVVKQEKMHKQTSKQTNNQTSKQTIPMIPNHSDEQLIRPIPQSSSLLDFSILEPRWRAQWPQLPLWMMLCCSPTWKNLICSYVSV